MKKNWRSANLVAMALVATLISGSEGVNEKATRKCPRIDPTHRTIHLPHEWDCTKFYKCTHGTPVLFKCPLMDHDGNRLHFNPVLEVCDWPEHAGCVQGPKPPTGGTSATSIWSTESIRSTSESSITPKDETTAVTSNDVNHPSGSSSPSVTNPPCGLPCGDINDGGLISHECSCDKFYQCSNGDLIRHQCPKGLHFNANIFSCDYPESAGCQVPTLRPTSIAPTTSTIPSECPAGNSGHTVQIPHPTNCSLFYKCDNGEKQLMECPAGLHFNPTIQMCDYPQAAGCTATSETTESIAATSTTWVPTSTAGPTHSSPSNASTTTIESTSESTESSAHSSTASLPSSSPSSTWITETTESSSTSRRYTETPSTSLSPTRTPGTTEASTTIGRSTGAGSTTQSTSSKPETTESSSTARSSTEAASTFETTTRIPGTSEASPTTRRSNETVSTSESSSRKPETTESSSTTQKSPGTAGTTEGTNSTSAYPDADCPPDMDGHQIPHETNCSLYYECDEGQKMLKECTQGLHFSSDFELCVWPANADCEFTTISPETTSPVSDEDSPEGRPTSPSGTSSGPEEVTTDSTIDPGTGSCIGTCPTKDPQDYTVMLPHKDCTKFCKCSNTKPYVYDCPTGLHFSPTEMICDYPKSAKCEGKGGYGQPANDD